MKERKQLFYFVLMALIGFLSFYTKDPIKIELFAAFDVIIGLIIFKQINDYKNRQYEFTKKIKIN